MLLKQAETSREEGVGNAKIILMSAWISLESDTHPVLLLLISFVFYFILFGGLGGDDGEDFQIFFVFLEDFYFAVGNLF